MSLKSPNYIKVKLHEPHMCGITFNQLDEVYDEMITLAGDNFTKITMRDVNEMLIKPICRKTNMSYAQHKNPTAKAGETFISHSWDEPFREFVTSIRNTYQEKVVKPTFWICAFSLIQSDAGGISSQIGLEDNTGTLEATPFIVALKHASSFVVVRNSKCDVYGRIWCICELMYGRKFGLVPDHTSVCGPDTFTGIKTSCTEAKCFNQTDKVIILNKLRNDYEVDDIDQFMLKFRSHDSNILHDSNAILTSSDRVNDQPSYGVDILSLLRPCFWLFGLVSKPCTLVLRNSVKLSNPKTIRVRSTRSKPNLKMTSGCHFHVFLSHVWSTGQDKAHRLGLMLQLHLPGIRVWLDINAENFKANELDHYVKDAELFVLFYTRGYFQSRNTRREVQVAFTSGKPFLVVYDGSTDIEIEKMKIEFKTYFSSDTSEVDKILDHILKVEPILWLGQQNILFTTVSVNLIVLRLLQILPYYRRNISKLDKGLLLGNKLASSKFTYPQKIVFCEDNMGITSLCRELKVIIGDKADFIEDSVSQKSDARDELVLLYLNKDTFQDEGCYGEKIIQFIRNALLNGKPIILVHEMDICRGHCDFMQLISQTPDELIANGLYAISAIPLFTQAEYRKVSIYTILKEMNDLCSD